ncbi:MAG: outer membrane beta-barrel family protein, partial [Ferruginibacter sp.]|nr:outer membrane beta-barrel family protein [Ferruginibacter sp.]
DYFVNKKTIFGIVVNAFTSNSTNDNDSRTDILSAAKDLESVTKALVTNDSRWNSFSTNLNFRTQFDSAGRELTAEADYISYTSTNSQFMVNTYFNADGNNIRIPDSLQGALPQDITIYSGRVDYVHPLKKGARFETGLKTSIVTTDNNASYDSIQNGMLVHDYNRSNHFVYDENINAAYANLSTSFSKKLSAQLGLRFENTIAKGNQLTTGEKFTRHYSQLFPTAYFQYKANEKNNFGINYGRRIRRPNYESLNPFIRFIDRYTYSQGNPDLKPQLSDNIELTHTYRNQFTTTLNYSATNNIIQMVIEQKGQEAYSKRANIASLRQFGIAFSANHSITKWWSNNFYINVFNNSFKGVVNSSPIAFSATSFSLNGTQQFKLSKTLSGELNGFYRSPGVEGVVKMKSMGMLAAGLSQQLWKNKGTLRLTVRDIFYTQRVRAEIKYGNVDAAFQEVRDSRVVNLGLTYRFSKGKIANTKKKVGGSAGEEQNRVGVD